VVSEQGKLILTRTVKRSILTNRFQSDSIY
jgi:hypothetical protein